MSIAKTILEIIDPERCRTLTSSYMVEMPNKNLIYIKKAPAVYAEALNIIL